MQSQNSSMWGFLKPYLRPYAPIICLGIALNALAGLAISSQTLVPKYLLDDVLAVSGLTTQERLTRLILLIGAYLIASIVFRMLFWHASYRIFTRIREKVLFQLRSQFFRQINSLCLRFHLRHNSGELYSYVFGSPLAQIQQYFQQVSMHAPGSIFVLGSTLIWIGSWDWAVAVVLLVFIGVNFYLMQVTRRRMKVLHHDFQATEGHVSGYVADLIRGNRDIKLFAMEEQVNEHFEVQVDLIGRKSFERDIKTHQQAMKQETAGYVFFGILTAVGSWRYLGGHLTGGELLSVLSALTMLNWPMQQLFLISTLQGGAEASLARLQSVLAEQSTTPDPLTEQAESGLKAQGASLTFEKVGFSYDAKPVLTDFNLSIPYGQRLALVGPSGSGKSTLAQLLLRFYDPQQGQVTLGDQSLKNFRSRDIRRLFGVVPQEPYLFATSLRDNMRLIRPDADDALIESCCRMANAWEFIEKLPLGLETVIGENGLSLSGGQRQRLAIARALLSDPPFFIFDEATSALDTISERLIQESLDRILVNRTAIFIAHRLSTVTTCDRVIVLQQGKILQDGTFAQLSTVPGLFRTMVECSALTR